MDTQNVHDVHMNNDTNIYTTSQPQEQSSQQIERRKYRSVLLNRGTVNFVRRIDPFRRLSRIIIDYAGYFLDYDDYDPDWFVEYRRRLIRDYGPPNYFSTSVSPRAVELLKQVKDNIGLRSIADAFDLVVLFYVNRHYCSSSRGPKPSICYSDEELEDLSEQKRGKK